MRCPARDRVAAVDEAIRRGRAYFEAVPPGTYPLKIEDAGVTLLDAPAEVTLRKHERRVIRETAGPFLDPVLETLRGQVALYQLYEADLWRDGDVAEPILHVERPAGKGRTRMALVKRGDITLWISDDAITSWKPVPAGGDEGRRRSSRITRSRQL